MKRNISLILLFIAQIFICTPQDNLITELEIGKKINEQLTSNSANFKAVLDEKIKEYDLSFKLQIENRNDHFLDGIILVSTNSKPNYSNSLLICGQIGKESCILSNKNLKSGDELYVSVQCEGCKFNFEVQYTKGELLHEGETVLFNLNQGEKRVFLFNPKSKSFTSVDITTYTINKTNFDMKVKMIKNANSIVEGKTTTGLIGNKKFTISQGDKEFSLGQRYQIEITALSKGIFHIDGKTSKTVTLLQENLVKFDTLKKGSRSCYKYHVNKLFRNEELMLSINALSGKTQFLVSPNFIPNEDKKFPIHFELKDKSELFEISPEVRNELYGGEGDWFICAVSKEENSLFTIQTYMKSYEPVDKIHKRNLIALANNEKIVHLENPKKFKRILAEVTPTVTNTARKGISVNGYGVAGLAGIFIFLFFVLIGSSCLSEIFVSTKFIDHPLILGKIEY